MGSGMTPGMITLDANASRRTCAADVGTVMDAVRNPECGRIPKNNLCYSETRATLHLHGGVTPWISDGTPHQWITPAGENTAYPEGVSVSNVPDMPDPGPGAQTFFYTNQQSARLMFYHDHAWGITRLNVYAGEAAGYVVTDPMEQKPDRARLPAPSPASASVHRSSSRTRPSCPAWTRWPRQTRRGTTPGGAEQATCGPRTYTCRRRTQAIPQG